MPRSQIVGGRGGIDTSEFHEAARALRKADAVLNRELRSSLRAAGFIVAERAKILAGAHSKKIADTIKVRTAGAGVEVRAGSADVPTAVLYELGNQQRRSRIGVAQEGGTFRHPVFGNRDVWVDQPRYPFLAPAAALSAAEVDREVGRAMDLVARTIAEG